MSANAKHTPGPWRVAHLERKTLGINVMASDGLYVAEAIAGLEEQGANACLIASAPDLLAALREALPYVEAYARLHEGSGEDIVAAADAARAAIRRAEGESK